MNIPVVRLSPDDIWPGRICIWQHTPRGGYGYSVRIPAMVIRRLPGGRVAILAALAGGGTKSVNVSLEKLCERNVLDPQPTITSSAALDSQGVEGE